MQFKVNKMDTETIASNLAPQSPNSLLSLTWMSWCSWVVITALSVLVCTGAVLAFVFLRGFVPNPYDAISISNSGNGGYAGNNGYHG